MKKEEMDKMIAEDKAFAVAVMQASEMGWNAAVEAIAIEFDNMKVFGDTAASFAIFVRGMKR
jgi:hypothetical protein